MTGGPDRSRLSLPLKSITSKDNNGSSEVTNKGSKLTQQKLMKSRSTSADYLVLNPNLQFPSSSSNFGRESENHPSLNRAQSIRDTISNGTAKFFGVPPPESLQSSVGLSVDPKWSCRRLRFICRHYGNPKEDILTKELRPQIMDDLIDVPSPSKGVKEQSEIREVLSMTTEISSARTFSRNKSVESRGSQLTQQHLERRDTVMKMICDRITSMVQKGTLKPKKGRTTVKRGRSVSSSFAPFSVQEGGNITQIRSEPPAVDIVVNVDVEARKLMNTTITPTEQDKKYELLSLKKGRTAIHFPSDVETTANSESLQNEVFFNYTSQIVSSNIFDEGNPVEDDVGNLRDDENPMQKMQLQFSKQKKSTVFSSVRSALSSPKEWLQNIQGIDERRTKRTVERTRKRLLLDTIYSELKSRKYSVSHHRRAGGGFGIWRKYFQRSYRKDVYHLNNDTYVDCRPFFTYWITTVQILVAVISLYTYGVSPWGFGLTEKTADVLHTTVTLKRVSIYVQQNIWFGPKFADLVHLGAKFTPCMREDPRIFERIEAVHREENETGCCIYNDGAGCFQTGWSTCPSLIATLAKWKKDSPGPEGRVSGAVCGQDPRYCEDPVSVKPYEWPDDITHWPVCKQITRFVPENVMHMQCEITGRPCCIQLHGQCRITTRDYCDFVEGYFHENATLCSQVSCLSEVCGMLPFLRKNRPDQWYRLFIPLFLHAGIIHCILTVFVQILYMRDLEKLLGWARVALLYMVSGTGGYLASAIFVPYQPEVGPAGAHVGMFAAMYADVLYSWNLLEKPWHAIMQLSLFTLALFAVGTLPWVDNWAHLFGFIFGILTSLAVLPYIQTKHHNRTRRLIIVTTSLSSALGLFIVLLTTFYWPSGFNCVYCEYFNCIPYTDHFCDNQGLRLKNWLPI